MYVELHEALNSVLFFCDIYFLFQKNVMIKLRLVTIKRICFLNLVHVQFLIAIKYNYCRYKSRKCHVTVTPVDL